MDFLAASSCLTQALAVVVARRRARNESAYPDDDLLLVSDLQSPVTPSQISFTATSATEV
ncbi:hypothetical protein BN949_02681 [Agrobacterium tumefaciens]|nr:hypothetical protein BN949_02681 [Agrobacterium tumefaciens]